MAARYRRVSGIDTLALEYSTRIPVEQIETRRPRIAFRYRYAEREKNSEFDEMCFRKANPTPDVRMTITITITTNIKVISERFSIPRYLL
jgi:hypothetical protein